MTKMKILGLFAFLPLLGIATVSCNRTKGPDYPITQEEAIERGNAPINLLDKKLQGRIAADQAMQQRIEDGRLYIAVNLRNRTTKDRHVLVRTVFKTKEGYATDDVTQWENIYFAPQQIVTYSAESRTVNPESYTVEVRLP